MVGAHERAHVKAFRERARLARGQAPALRLPRRHRERRALPPDRGRVRGPRGRGVQGPGAADPAPRLPRPGARHPHRRGAPRRLDPPPRGHHARGDAFDEPRSKQEHARDRRRHALRGHEGDAAGSARNSPAEAAARGRGVLVAAAGGALALAGQRDAAERPGRVAAAPPALDTGAGAAMPAFTVGAPVPLQRTGATRRAGRRCAAASLARARPTARAAVVAVLDAPDARGARPTSSPRSPASRDADGRIWVKVRLPVAAQRQHRLGPALGARRLRHRDARAS